MSGDPESEPDKRPEGRYPAASDGAGGTFALVGMGFEFVAAICVCGAAGWWADRRWNTFPWLMIVGGGIGFAAGLTMIVRAGKNAFKD